MENTQLNPLIFVVKNFIETIEKHPQLLYADTDSVLGNTIINIDGKDIEIQEFYNYSGNLVKEESNNFVKQFDKDYNSLSLNNTFEIENKKVLYCMKHKVKKNFFKIKTNNDSVVVTEDHSIIVLREGKMISIKPNEVKNNDRLFKIHRKA